MIENRDTLKEKFGSGKFPNGQDYSNLIDSYVHKDDRYSTQADLTKYQGVEGEIAQHIGVTTETLTNGYFYKKTNNIWSRINVQSSGEGTQLSAGEAIAISDKEVSVFYDAERLTTTADNKLTLKNPIQVDLNSYLGGKQGDIVQHIGNDENGYVNGHFYQYKSDGEITDVPNHFWLDTFGIKLEGEYVRTNETIENFEQKIDLDINPNRKKIVFDRVWKVQQISTSNYYYAAVLNPKDFTGADYLAFWIIELDHEIILAAPVNNGPVRVSKWVRIDVQPASIMPELDDEVSESSSNAVKSSGIYNALNAKLDGTSGKGAKSSQLGLGTIAYSPYQIVMGRYNVPDTTGKYALIVGNGISDTERSNAFCVTWDGKIESDDMNTLIRNLGGVAGIQAVNFEDDACEPNVLYIVTE